MSLSSTFQHLCLEADDLQVRTLTSSHLMLPASAAAAVFRGQRGLQFKASALGSSISAGHL